MRRKLTVTTPSVVTAVALGFGVPAIAQDDGSSGTSSDGSRADGSNDREEQHAERQAEEAERRTAMEERLAAAVGDGRLTQGQADSLLEAMENGAFRGDGRGGHGRHGGPGGAAEVPADPSASTT